VDRLKLSHRQVLALIGVIAVLVAAPILLYRIRPVVGIAAAFGSGAIALIVLAHLGVIAAVIAPVVLWRRRTRR
jgi:hypothetical protein